MGSTSFCNGESVMLMGNNGGTWSNGSTAADITVSTAGVYSVTTTNTCGTTTSNSITVTVTQAPTAAVISAMGATTFCEGNSLMLMGNNGGTWSNGSTAASIFVNQTGTYSVTTSNSCGSTTSNAITVTVNPLPTAPTISAMGATTFCSGGSVMLMGNSGGTWSNGSNAASITVSTAGVYNVTNTNACGTTTSNSITVTVTQAPTAAVISAMGATTFCEGNSLMLMGNNGGTWSNGSTAASIFVNQSGTYSVTTSNSCGSTTSNSISVTVNPGPTASLITASGPTNFCEGGSVTLVGNTTGVWSTGANSATLNVTQSGSYFVSSINACGATTSNTIVVNVQSLPTASVITANGSINICSGSTINLSGNNGGVWSTGSSASSIDVSQAGNYSVTTTNACGSTTSNSIDITVINVDTSVTVGSASLLANATNASYQWLLCNGLYSVIAGETNQTFQPTMFTAFYAVAVSQNGCSDTSSCHYFMFTDLASIHPNTNAGISIYPNPATNTIVMGGVHHQDVKIINNLGETVLLYNNYNDQQRIDVSSLSSGIYFVKSNNYLTKFIKQ